MKNVQLSLSTAELLKLSALILLVTRNVKYDKGLDVYVSHSLGSFVATKKEMAALRSIARKLGVK